MFGMGMGELIVILIVALLVLGPDKLPEAAKAISKGVRELRKQTRVVQDTIEQDEQLGATVRDLKSMLRGEEPRPVIKPPMHGPVGRAAIEPTPATSPAPALAAAEPPTVIVSDEAAAAATTAADGKPAGTTDSGSGNA